MVLERVSIAKVQEEFNTEPEEKIRGQSRSGTQNYTAIFWCTTIPYHFVFGRGRERKEKGSKKGAEKRARTKGTGKGRKERKRSEKTIERRSRE